MKIAVLERESDGLVRRDTGAPRGRSQAPHQQTGEWALARRVGPARLCERRPTISYRMVGPRCACPTLRPTPVLGVDALVRAVDLVDEADQRAAADGVLQLAHGLGLDLT